jgi:hypothetical protein
VCAHACVCCGRPLLTAQQAQAVHLVAACAAPARRCGRAAAWRARRSATHSLPSVSARHYPPRLACTLPASRAATAAQQQQVGVAARRESLGATLAGLQEMLVYGLKGMAAYTHHAGWWRRARACSACAVAVTVRRSGVACGGVWCGGVWWRVVACGVVACGVFECSVRHTRLAGALHLVSGVASAALAGRRAIPRAPPLAPAGAPRAPPHACRVLPQRRRASADAAPRGRLPA